MSTVLKNITIALSNIMSCLELKNLKFNNKILQYFKEKAQERSRDSCESK